jgi:hypothetical protein
MATESIFGRDADLERLRHMLGKRRSFLLHGPTGVGKSLLARQLASESNDILYCSDSATPQTIFRTLAAELLNRRAARVVKAFGRLERIKQMSAVSLKGVVVDALATGTYWIVLDHLRCPSQILASSVRELANRGSTPVLAITRSAHMEDVGFLRSMFAGGSEKYSLLNFESDTALVFAENIATRVALTTSNTSEFLDKVVKYSGGNPGAIIAMLNMTKNPKYRSNDGRIKLSPLYIDFRLGWDG